LGERRVRRVMREGSEERGELREKGVRIGGS
jgi:hypothetical protein